MAFHYFSMEPSEFPRESNDIEDAVVSNRDLIYTGTPAGVAVGALIESGASATELRVVI